MSNRELANTARAIAIEAGRLIVRMRGTGVTIAASKSSAVDIVTEADRAAETLVHSRLAELRPDDSILGEEGTSIQGTGEITWIVDPIDGTVNYLYGIPAFAVSVAATIPGTGPDGRVAVAGCVFNPITGECFTGIRGEGAFCSIVDAELSIDAIRNDDLGTRLSTTIPDSLAVSLVGTGFGYRAEKRRDQAQIMARLLPLVRDIRRIGSAALDLCNVAAGRLDGFYESGLQPWDYAAGILIAEEAGADVLGPLAGSSESISSAGSSSAGRPGEELVVAAAPRIADELRELVGGAS